MSQAPCMSCTTLMAKETTARLQTETATARYEFFGTYEGTAASAEAPFYYINTSGTLSLGNQNSIVVGPYRWIIRATSKTGSGFEYAPKLSFYDGGGTTGFDGVRGLTEDGRGDIYDLQGRRVTNPTKGIYIVNGKKVIIK